MKIPITRTDEPFEHHQEDAEAADRRERDERIVGWFENVFHIILAYQAHQQTAKEKTMSIRAMALALGFHLAAGAEGPAELAKRCGVSKQTLGKCLNHFIAQLKLSPLPFQRKADARKNMAEARKRQVADVRKCGQLNPNFLK